MAKTKQAADLSLVTDDSKASERKRRNEAVMNATCQLESIFDTIVALARQERGEIPEWPGFDSEHIPDIIRALAIRGSALNSAVWPASLDETSIEDLEKVVFHG